jgi:hypothetical protein
LRRGVTRQAGFDAFRIDPARFAPTSQPMDLTVYLARVLGLFLIFAGAAMILRRRYLIPVIGSFVQERLTRVLYAFMELLAGLFLVVGHNQWSSPPAAIITILGWLAILEAASYLLLPDETVDRFVRGFNVPAWYVGGGIAVIVLGLYLAGFGFSWL